ncbi:hypothetical protein JCM10914A_24860 [Paenibacillus sp. JCM 10914]|uniref:DUF5317 domain-containing protein n=1 Tax=Paenibacillus sp. JCM 10914 TaxID=1236974 RepID=UPI0003CC4F06|nr:DUF5317 domain-containing protein [Paenibacillus sp. JCM 10914]GAE08972.1 hypothetical protein JCM10914_5310 [Paenibacillus sp. JCM 10914]
MVFDGIILGFIVGLIRGGFQHGLQQFSRIRLKGGLIFPILLVLQLLIFRFQGDSEWLTAASGYIFLSIYVAGMIFLWLNRDQKGFRSILVGVFLNFLVMAVNGGRMPVSMNAAMVLDPIYIERLMDTTATTKHFLMDASTRLSLLGDIIPLSPPYPRTQVISIGDIIMNIGIFLYIVNLMTVGKNTSSSSVVRTSDAPEHAEPQN